MKQKILLLTSLLFLAIPSVADIYPGYEQIGTGQITEVETPGNTRQGLINTVMAMMLVGPVGDEFEVKVPKATHPDPSIGSDPFVAEFEPVFKLRIKHQKVKKEAHLVVIIPGFGASNKEAAAPYLCELLNRNGFVTMSSHSPANPEFIEFSSSLAVPGNQIWDAQDLYKMIRAAKLQAENEFGYSFARVSVVGASLGSINAFHVAGLDLKSKDPINFYRVLSINPPISNVYGSTAIDTFVAQTVPDSLEFNFVETLSALNDLITNTGVSYFMDRKFESMGRNSKKARQKLMDSSISTSRLKFLVGFAFAPTVDDVIVAGLKRYDEEAAATRFSRSQMRPVKFFTDFLYRYSFKNTFIAFKFNHNEKSYSSKLADSFSFDEKKYPHFNRSEKESIGHLLPTWQKKYDLSHFHIVTWHDDFLLRNSDPRWIEENLSGGKKGHSKVFRNGGGHLGGYWQKDFHDYLINALK